MPPKLPTKLNGEFFWERFWQSVNALQQISLQNKGVPGRKNIIWVGHGGPNLVLDGNIDIAPKMVKELREYVHMTTNMLVADRISLFVIYPGLPVTSLSNRSVVDASLDLTLGSDDPFAGDVNFGLLSNETGGKLFYNQNDLDAEIAHSVRLGSNYYTLTYQPQYVNPDGKFRRVRVTVRDRSLRVITKSGYFAPNDKAVIPPDQQHMMNLVEALRSAFPIHSLDVDISNVLRHPDAGSIQLNVVVNAKDLDYIPDEESGNESVHLFIAAASLNASRRMLAARVSGISSRATTTDSGKLANVALGIPFTVPFPRKTKTVRIVVEDQNSGRIGSVELDRSFVDLAPEVPTPDPELVPRRPESTKTERPPVK